MNGVSSIATIHIPKTHEAGTLAHLDFENPPSDSLQWTNLDIVHVWNHFNIF